ncbi:protoporphyrinogen oxidase [Hydrogenivirga caldilitoris]|uniref:Coproporphyrinogen III oxidase n=1 Tax=Hydrogenivirga caldilitoris TaxID=246264 RepID=A0A497XSP6_9AQUI|nr:protoporphyrinogen oxidase [Hydrogenivirga caldilitoris]RLJ69943.1 protoporphyrinogen oxidase [Hydrogenivirga caldilitoris]
MRDIVIIGSGISGLSTAFRLRKLGYDVVVYEKDEDIGGNIKTATQEGYTFELGPQTVLADEEVMAFFKEAGLEPLVASPSSKNRYIYKGGKLVPLPMSPLLFLFSPLLSLTAKLRVLKEPWASGPVKNEESIADFVRRRLGQEFLDYIVAPFVSGVYAGDPERLSVKYATRRVYALEQEFGSLIRGALKKKALGPKGVLVSFEGGLYTLIRELARGVEVKRENVVLKIRKKEDRFILDTREGKVETKALVVSSPAYTASYLLKDLSWSASLEFDRIDYVPVVVVNVGVKSGNVPEGFGVLIPRREGKRILGAVFSSKLFPGRAPAGKDLLTVYLGGATDREIIELSNEAITEIVQKELREVLGINSIDFIHVRKWKRAIPQYTLGYGKYLNLAKEMEEIHRGLFLTGNYLSGVSVSDCIRFSEVTAKKVSEFLQ